MAHEESLALLRKFHGEDAAKSDIAAMLNHVGSVRQPSCRSCTACNDDLDDCDCGALVLPPSLPRSENAADDDRPTLSPCLAHSRFRTPHHGAWGDALSSLSTGATAPASQPAQCKAPGPGTLVTARF